MSDNNDRLWESYHGEDSGKTFSCPSDPTIKIGMFETQGKRSTQEDSMGGFTIPIFNALTPKQRETTLKETFARLQKKCGRNPHCGSTALATIAQRTADTVQTCTMSVGDSTSFLVIVDRNGKFKECRRLNRVLHNPKSGDDYGDEVDRVRKAIRENWQGQETILDEEGNKIIINRRLIEGALDLHGRVISVAGNKVGELANSRAIGDTGAERFGLIHDGDYDTQETHLNPGERAFIVHACDGLTENDALTAQKIGEIVASNHTKNMSVVAQFLVEAALRAGSGDNISVAVFEINSATPTGAFIADGHGGYAVADALGTHFYSVLQNTIEQNFFPILTQLPKLINAISEPKSRTFFGKPYQKSEQIIADRSVAEISSFQSKILQGKLSPADTTPEKLAIILLNAYLKNYQQNRHDGLLARTLRNQLHQIIPTLANTSTVKTKGWSMLNGESHQDGDKILAYIGENHKDLVKELIKNIPSEYFIVSEKQRNDWFLNRIKMLYRMGVEYINIPNIKNPEVFEKLMLGDEKKIKDQLQYYGYSFGKFQIPPFVKIPGKKESIDIRTDWTQAAKKDADLYTQPTTIADQTLHSEKF